MSMPRYSCIASMLTISPPSRSARSSARSDLPVAVGPTTAIGTGDLTDATPPRGSRRRTGRRAVQRPAGSGWRVEHAGEHLPRDAPADAEGPRTAAGSRASSASRSPVSSARVDPGLHALRTRVERARRLRRESVRAVRDDRPARAAPRSRSRSGAQFRAVRGALVGRRVGGEDPRVDDGVRRARPAHPPGRQRRERQVGVADRARRTGPQRDPHVDAEAAERALARRAAPPPRLAPLRPPPTRLASADERTSPAVWTASAQRRRLRSGRPGQFGHQERWRRQPGLRR